MRYYIIAGEASGDMHAANLMAALQKEDAHAEFRYFGGDRMAAVSQQKPTRHIRDLAFMGFVEIVANLKTILGLISECKKDVLAFQADALILIDYPGFNIRMAEWAKKQGISAFYYISPQVWAWKKGRVHTIMKNVEQLYTILPFEADFYKKYGYDVAYVGHPLLEEIRKEKKENAFQHPKPYVALLPGSRKQEIRKLMPIMAEVARQWPKQDFIVATAPTIEVSMLEKYAQQLKNIHIQSGQTYAIIKNAQAAIVTSGTATLETALFQTPQIVVYKGSPISFWIAKRLVNVSYISLVNLIQDAAVVPELIQEDCTVEKITTHLQPLLQENHPKRKSMLQSYQNLWEKIDQKGGASALVAQDIVHRLHTSQ